MRKLIKIFLDMVFSIQEKKHKELVQKTMYSYQNSTSKSHITSFATVSFNAKSSQKATLLKQTVKKIVVKNIKTPEKLLEYMEKSGTKVIKTKFADKILDYVGLEEGFIAPKEGFEALYLNLMLNKKFGFKTAEMFILRDLPLNIYALSHQFHKWYSYKMNLPGYDAKTQEKFKRVFEYENSNKAKELSYQEIMDLKEAIKRDNEAIDFVLELSREQESSSLSLEKIKNGEAISV